jgi:hypothetical protein
MSSSLRLVTNTLKTDFACRSELTNSRTLRRSLSGHSSSPSRMMYVCLYSEVRLTRFVKFATSVGSRHSLFARCSHPGRWVWARHSCLNIARISASAPRKDRSSKAKYAKHKADCPTCLEALSSRYLMTCELHITISKSKKGRARTLRLTPRQIYQSQLDAVC